MQLGVRGAAGGSGGGPVTEVSPPATTCRYTKTHTLLCCMIKTESEVLGLHQGDFRYSSHNWKTVCVYLQLYCACGALQQTDSLSVGHAFSRAPTDTDDAVPNLQ